MAIGATVSGTCIRNDNSDGVKGSVLGVWKVINDNAETAQTSGDELAPLAIDDSTFHWCRVPAGATRVLVRAKIDDAATVTTSPTFFLMGAYPDESELDNPGWDPATAATGEVTFMRLDNADANAAAVTITVEVGTAVVTDGTWDIANPTSLDGYDLRGAWAIGAIVDTAANTSTGTVPIEVLFLN